MNYFPPLVFDFIYRKNTEDVTHDEFAFIQFMACPFIKLENKLIVNISKVHRVHWFNDEYIFIFQAMCGLKKISVYNKKGISKLSL